MNNGIINDLIAEKETSGARPDFADLMARIEADGGKSTTAQYKASKSPARKVISIAACVTAVAALSAAAAVITMAYGGAVSESADTACDMIIMDEAVCEESTCVDDCDSVAENQSSMEMAEADGSAAVSDSDVSDSDLSDSDADEDQ